MGKRGPKEIGYTMDEVLRAIGGSRGIMTRIARTLGCDRATAKRYINRWETTKNAYWQERETIVDISEDVIVYDIEVNRNVKTAKWAASRLGRSRGWGDDADGRDDDDAGDDVIEVELG